MFIKIADAAGSTMNRLRRQSSMKDVKVQEADPDGQGGDALCRFPTGTPIIEKK